MAGELKIQVVGFPGTPYRRLKTELKSVHDLQGVVVRFAPSYDDHRSTIGRKEIGEIESNVQDGFVHIAVFPTRDFSSLRNFELDCRVIRLNLVANFRMLTAEQVVEAVRQAAEYEVRWSRVLRPEDWHHPLCLPRPSFEIDRDLGDYWKTCDCYGDTERIGVAHDLVQKVISRHRNSLDRVGTYWLDITSKRFAIDKSHHGLTATQREGKKEFRFTWEVPPGLHFDVTHENVGKAIRIRSFLNQIHFCTRANVNSWGHVHVRS